jgi:tetratricopeptide (TPR) repeat protein
MKPALSFLILIYATWCVSGNNIILAESHSVDTASVSVILKHASDAEEARPDSSVLYYRMAIEKITVALNTSGRSKDVTGSLKKKLIEAQTGLGLLFYRQVNYDDAIKCFDAAYSIAKELNDPVSEADCLFNYAEVFLEQSKYTDAMTDYYRALQLYQTVSNESGAYWCYVGMGIVQKQCGNYNDAVICYKKAHEIAVSSGMKLEAAYCYNNLGIVYRRQGDMARAMENYKLALDCFTDMKDNLAASDCLNNIGNLYLDKGDPQRALDYITRSVSFREVQADNYRMISRYMNLSDTYAAMRDLKNASLCIEKAIGLAEKAEDKLQLASCYSQAGTLQTANGSAAEGIKFFNKSCDLFHSIGAKVEEAECLVELADAELKAGRTDDAFKHASEAETISKTNGGIKTIYQVNTCLAKIWEKKGVPSIALACMKTASQLQDSIFNIDKNRTVEEIEAGYTLSRLENENQILQQKEQLQQQALRLRNIALFSLTLILVLAIFVIWLIMRRQHDLRLIAKREEEIKQKEIDRLNENLSFKERELTTKTLFITQKNTLIQKLISEFDELKTEPDKAVLRLDQLKRELKSELTPNAWKEFEAQFNEVHPGFQSRLIEKFPDLSQSERRLCAFLHLDMNNREIAALTGQTAKSLEVARTRIRKKMNLSREANLANFIATI